MTDTNELKKHYPYGRAEKRKSYFPLSPAAGMYWLQIVIQGGGRRGNQTDKTVVCTSNLQSLFSNMYCVYVTYLTA